MYSCIARLRVGMYLPIRYLLLYIFFRFNGDNCCGGVQRSSEQCDVRCVLRWSSGARSIHTCKQELEGDRLTEAVRIIVRLAISRVDRFRC